MQSNPDKKKTNFAWYDAEMDFIYLYALLILIFIHQLWGERSFCFVAAGYLWSCWWSVSKTDHALCSLCGLLLKPKLMLFYYFFWVYSQIGLLVFLLSLDLVPSREKPTLWQRYCRYYSQL